MRISVSLAALAATLAIATPALAQQATATATPNPIAKGTVVLPLTLTKTQDLDFGTVIPSSTGAGTVAISADDGSRAVTGGVIGVSAFPGDRALFQGAGTSGQNVLLTLQAPATLTSGSNSIAVNSMYFDSTGAGAGSVNTTTGYLETTRTIDGTGAFSVGVGGTFAIAKNQPNGLYQAPFIVTADYQ